MATTLLPRPERLTVRHENGHRGSHGDAASSLEDFLRFQLGVSRKMQRVTPPPTREELAVHTKRVCTTCRQLIEYEHLDHTRRLKIESDVIPGIADCTSTTDLLRVIGAGLRICEGRDVEGDIEELVSRHVNSCSAEGNVLEACSRLWDLDVNRLTPGVDYEINLQGRSRGYSSDAASDSLFSFIADDVWQKPSFRTFFALLDNYSAETGKEEEVSVQVRHEQQDFLEAVSTTPCMRFVYSWLVDRRQIHVRDMSEFKDMLSTIWFSLYRRKESRDSSAFEHVFAGEVDEGKVKGMHSFLQLYKEEKAGAFNYKGYLLPRDRKNSLTTSSSNAHLLTIRFDWLGVTKAASGVLFGVSPEFEMALYTILFVSGKRENVVDLGPYKARITVHPMGNKIGTAYPEELTPSPEEVNTDAVMTLQLAYRRLVEQRALNGRKKDDHDLGHKINKLIKVGGQLGKLFGLF